MIATKKVEPCHTDAASNHILFHHDETTDGYIALCRKNSQTGRFTQFFYRPNDLAAHLNDFMGEDVFFSQNTFYRKMRQISTVRQLRSLYVDLDFYTLGLNREWVLGKLEQEFYRQSIPEPNLIINSGQGLVLVWLLEPVPHMALSLWKAVEDYLVAQLKELGADPKAVDPARIFRLAGTTSSKNGAEVSVEIRHDHRFELRGIQYDYLPELKPRPKESPKPRGKESQIIRLFNQYTLYHSRLRDLDKLVSLRGGHMDGFRETTLFLYRYWSCCFTRDPESALQQALEFNQQFTHPLPEREVTSHTKSAEKAYEAKSDKAANERAIAMGYPGAGYRISNKKLIDWLDISEDEQRHLETIIGTKEKQRRNRELKKKQRREAGMRPMEEYNKHREDAKADKAAILQQALAENPGLSNRKLAALLNWSEATVRRLKKAL